MKYILEGDIEALIENIVDYKLKKIPLRERIIKRKEFYILMDNSNEFNHDICNHNKDYDDKETTYEFNFIYIFCSVDICNHTAKWNYDTYGEVDYDDIIVMGG